MLDQLQMLVKEDDESREKFNAILTDHNEREEKNQKVLVSQAKRTVVVISALTVLFIGSILYSLNIKTRFDEKIDILQNELALTKNQLSDCIEKQE